MADRWDVLLTDARLATLTGRDEAQIRRASREVEPSPRLSEAPDQLRFGPIVVDLRAREVSVAGERVALGPLEFKLLEYLARNAGVAISREQILQHVYGYGAGNSPERVDMLVRRVRIKLNAEERLASVPGYGFRWEARTS